MDMEKEVKIKDNCEGVRLNVNINMERKLWYADIFEKSRDIDNINITVRINDLFRVKFDINQIDNQLNDDIITAVNAFTEREHKRLNNNE